VGEDTTSTPVLEAVELTKTYADGTAALRGASFHLEEGVFGLLGENGAGKSTTLSIIALRLQPTAGTVRYHGVDATDARRRPSILRRLGFLPQTFEPVHALTCGEYLGHCARLRGVVLPRRQLRERIGRLLEAMDLADRADRPTRELSGGMKRRLGVCQALVHDPDLVILDEPTAGLDPEQRILLRNVIAEEGRRRTVLLSSHVVDDIDQTCHRLVVISAGRVLYEGSPGDLLRRFAPHLWELPGLSDADPERPQAASGPPPEPGHVLGFLGERASRVVFAEQRPPRARPRRATLEEAYGALLVTAAR